MTRILPTAGFLLASSVAAFSQALVPSTKEVAEATFLNGWQQPDGSWIGAVEITLRDGWHTYWRIPGEAGVVPSFDWSRSDNLASASVEWPHPAIFDSWGMLTFGYRDSLVLPIHLTPKIRDAPIAIDFEMSYGVCEEICMLAKSDFQTTLAAGAAPQSRDVIEGALSRRTRSAAEAGVTNATCAISADGSTIAMDTAVTFPNPQRPGQYTVVESHAPGAWITFADSRNGGNQVLSRTRMDARRGGLIDRSSLRITILDDIRSVEVDGCRGNG